MIDSFNEYIAFIADILLVSRRKSFRENSVKRVQSAFFLFERNLSVHACCNGAFAWGICKRICVAVADIANKCACCIKIFLCFLRKTHNYIGGYFNILNTGPKFIDKSIIIRTRVFSVHKSENSVASGLYRQMNMLAYFVKRRHCIDEFIREILRMRCHKPEPFQSSNLIIDAL